MKPVVIDADTGEVIENYRIKSNRERIPEGVHNIKFQLNSNGLATQDNAQEWVDTVYCRDETIEYVDLKDSGRFVKVFSDEAVEFSVPEYEIYWNRIIKNLIYNMNIIYCIDDGKKRPAYAQTDLMTICDISRTTFYRFYLEAKQKKYIAVFKTGHRVDTRYVINPKYALCGNEMPRYLYDIFNSSMVIEEDDEYN